MHISPKIDKPDFINFIFPKRENFFVNGTEGINDSEKVELPLVDGISATCQFYFSDGEAPTIIVFPSTTTPLEQCVEIATGHVKRNNNVLVCTYRGDNSKDERNSLDTFLKDGKTLLEKAFELLESKGAKGPVFLMGQSLGALIVLEVADENKEKVKGLLLESTVCEIESYLEAFGANLNAVQINESDRLGAIESIEKIELPTLFFHGSRDEFVPAAMAEKLQASSGARTKQFFIIPGGKHEGLHITGGDLYFETIKTFLDTVCGVNTWRQKRRKYKKG